MKAIKYFVWITTAICAIGCLMLLNDGELDLYAVWNMVTLGLASYYMSKK